MVMIKWLITDDLLGVNLEDFNNEWNCIEGYFELVINNHCIGFCPQREVVEEGEDGLEDILYWLIELNRGKEHLKKGNNYEFHLLTRNLYKLILQKKDWVEISYIRIDNNEIAWVEKVELFELEQEINRSIEKFKNKIMDINPILLSSKLLKELIV